MKKSLFAIALGAAVFASDVQAGYQTTCLPPNTKLTQSLTQTISPQADFSESLSDLLDTTLRQLDRMNCDYAELISRINVDRQFARHDSSVARPPVLQRPSIQKLTASDCVYLKPYQPSKLDTNRFLAHDPIRSRHLLEEYQPSQFNFCNSAWISRMHHQHLSNATPANANIAATVANTIARADQDLDFVRISNAMCAQASISVAPKLNVERISIAKINTAVVPTIAAIEIPRLAPSTKAFVIYRLPIDYTITTAQPDFLIAASTKLIPATLPEIRDDASLRGMFGASVLPKLNLHPVGLASLHLNRANLLSTPTRFCNLGDDQQVADRMLADAARAKGIDVSLNDLLALGLSRVKYSLSAAYGFIDQLECGLSPARQANMAAKGNSTR